MTERRKLLIRLMLSGLIGVVVALVPLFLVVGGPTSRDIKFQRKYTRSALNHMDQLLNEYRRQHRKYPADLKRFGYAVQDGWGRPFTYSVPQGRPLVESLGQDGKRGGIGMNADSSNQNPKPPEAHVPFLIRVTDPDALQMSFVALFCGITAAFMVYSGLQHQTFATRFWLPLGLSLLVALGMACFGAIFITIMHTPSGH